MRRKEHAKTNAQQFDIKKQGRNNVKLWKTRKNQSKTRGKPGKLGKNQRETREQRVEGDDATGQPSQERMVEGDDATC